MFRKIDNNIREIDEQIGKLTKELNDLEYEQAYDMKMNRIKDLTDLRTKLAESREEGSVKGIVTSGALSIASVLIILKYEEKEIITSKAYSIATSMFRGK